MPSETPCERCGNVALSDSIHIENSRHQLCRACFTDVTAEYVRDQPDRAAEIARQFGLPWPETGAERLSAILVDGFVKVQGEMTERFGDSGTT